MEEVRKDRASVDVLIECIELQRKKDRDYQSEESPIRQADYYRNGIDSIYEMLHTKMLRVLSLTHSAKKGREPNFEGIEDSLKDLINYASFGVAYIRGGIDGQDPDRDMFNRPKVRAKKAGAYHVNVPVPGPGNDVEWDAITADPIITAGWTDRT